MNTATTATTAIRPIELSGPSRPQGLPPSSRSPNSKRTLVLIPKPTQKSHGQVSRPHTNVSNLRLIEHFPVLNVSYREN